MKAYNKLVRDNIPALIEGKGEKCLYHKASGPEFYEKLKEKLREEVEEFLKDETEEEIADIYEVINAIIEAKGFDRSGIESLQRQKREEKGGFNEQLILDEAD